MDRGPVNRRVSIQSVLIFLLFRTDGDRGTRSEATLSVVVETGQERPPVTLLARYRFERTAARISIAEGTAGVLETAARRPRGVPVLPVGLLGSVWCSRGKK